MKAIVIIVLVFISVSLGIGFAGYFLDMLIGDGYGIGMVLSILCNMVWGVFFVISGIPFYFLDRFGGSS